MGVTYIARISKPGYSVYDPDPKNFSLREDTNSPKAFIRGSVEAPPGSTSASATVTHNLGYKPFFLGYMVRKANNRAIPVFRGSSDNNQININSYWVEWPPSWGGYTLYYDIFYEGGA